MLVHETMTTRKWSSGTIKFSRKKQGNTRHSSWLRVGENKEGNLENLFLHAQWPSILYSTKSTEIKVKQENETSYSIIFYSRHKRLAVVTLIIPTTLKNIKRNFLLVNSR